MRDAAIAIIREIGVEAGGCNIQFAVNPANGEMLVVEMNPRVSRSLRTRIQGDGFPDRADRRQARRRLPLDELPNDITKTHAGLVRADARLRGREVPALRVREIPDRRQRRWACR